MPCGYCSDTTKRVILMVLKIAGEVTLVCAIASVFLIAAQARHDDIIAEENAAREYMKQLSINDGDAKNKLAIANWNYDSNITEYNKNVLDTVSLEVAKQQKDAWAETMTYAYNEFEDEELERMFKLYGNIGDTALPEDLLQRLNDAINNMKTIYATATICAYNDSSKCDLYIEPEITNIFSDSEDAEELKHTWVEWHKVSGAPTKDDFKEYVSLKNEAAKLNGFDNNAEMWLSVYEDASIESQFYDLCAQIKPLYEQLHAYVRRNLRLKYGEHVVSKDGPIPAHLLGNVWAQTWSRVESFGRPYPNKLEADYTKALIEKNYTALKMFQMADEFFVSLNLTEVPDSFWEKSIIEKPEDVNLVCHASAWDFFDGKDFRIKQCTTITSKYFQTTHHEMGHIQYYLQYKDLPTIFKAGANPGFHEAVGDVMSLSVSTPKHMKLIGLLDEIEDDEESDINQLYKMGLDKIAFVPFAFLLDIYRYSIFRGHTTPDDYNCHFWSLREVLQGIEPPVNRSENDFDATAKYHVSTDVEYMRYFVSYIVQFQFHKALCLHANEYNPNDPTKPLYNCDIYNSTDAGNALSEMLKLGASKPWPEAMEALTGQRYMDASGLLEYFDPLHQWLKAENEKNGEFVGWVESKVQYCTDQQLQAMGGSDFDDDLKKLKNGSR